MKKKIIIKTEKEKYEQITEENIIILINAAKKMELIENYNIINQNISSNKKKVEKMNLKKNYMIRIDGKNQNIELLQCLNT